MQIRISNESTQYAMGSDADPKGFEGEQKVLNVQNIGVAEFRSVMEHCEIVITIVLHIQETWMQLKCFHNRIKIACFGILKEFLQEFCSSCTGVMH